MLKYGITFPLYESQRSTEWRDSHIPCFDIYSIKQKEADMVITYLQNILLRKQVYIK